MFLWTAVKNVDLTDSSFVWQIVVLARVISGLDEVTLTARGVTVLVELLQSDQSTTVVITGTF